MELKEYVYNSLKGVIASIAVTVILTAIFSLIMCFVEISSSTFSGIYVGLTSIALIFGSILSAKLQGSKGWLVGIAVGVLYYIALYGIGILFGAEATLGNLDLIKFLLCIFVGMLSGMLGMNIGKER